ncbi:MAG: hypothetical protein ACRDHZ_23245, partial [Ktedonobacteraceae bacterium]
AQDQPTIASSKPAQMVEHSDTFHYKFAVSQTFLINIPDALVSAGNGIGGLNTTLDSSATMLYDKERPVEARNIPMHISRAKNPRCQGEYPAITPCSSIEQKQRSSCFSHGKKAVVCRVPAEHITVSADKRPSRSFIWLSKRKTPNNQRSLFKMRRR